MAETNRTDATPADAKRVWEGMHEPSTRKVAAVLAQEGKPVSNRTVGLWRKAGWAETRAQAKPEAKTVREAEPPPPPAVTAATQVIAEVEQQLPALPITDRTLPVVGAIEEAARDGLDAARSVFAVVQHNPMLVQTMPANVGVLLERTGNFVVKLTEALGGRPQALAAGMVDVTPTGPRPRDTDPLKQGLEATDEAIRKWSHAP